MYYYDNIKEFIQKSYLFIMITKITTIPSLTNLISINSLITPFFITKKLFIFLSENARTPAKII